MNLTVENIARVCHEANRAYCAAIGDNSQVAWDDASEGQRASVIHGVKFRIENPHYPPSRSHAEWLAHKLAEGWKCGPVKDETKREHPNMVPFDELSEEQQRKDILFSVVVGAITYPLKEIIPL